MLKHHHVRDQQKVLTLEEDLLTLLHSEPPKLHRVLAVLSAKGLTEATEPSEAMFHVELPWVRRTKVCSHDLGHMKKMVAMSIL